MQLQPCLNPWLHVLQKAPADEAKGSSASPLKVSLTGYSLSDERHPIACFFYTRVVVLLLLFLNQSNTDIMN